MHTLCVEMKIPRGKQSNMYNELRDRLKEMSNNHVSCNISVGSKSIGGSSSKRSSDDFQSSSNSDNNIINILDDLLNKNWFKKIVLDQNNKKFKENCRQKQRVGRSSQKQRVGGK